ncbi:MAG: PadR family transcriptional regulator [Spirochaetes bacterium]|nr:PadR family transcriptional regulator [Spirochaetota bacterium]
MSLQNAILGLLNKYPLSGYDITKIFDHGIKHYWSTEHTQVYRTLASLKKKDLIDCETVHQTGKPDKKIYKITESGKSQLSQWLREPLPLPEIRHSQLIQLSYMADYDTDFIIKFLKSYESLILEKLDIYTDPDHEKNTIDYATSEKEKELWKIILDNGIEYYKNEIKWIKNSIKRLEKFKTSKS